MHSLNKTNHAIPFQRNLYKFGTINLLMTSYCEETCTYALLYHDTGFARYTLSCSKEQYL